MLPRVSVTLCHLEGAPAFQIKPLRPHGVKTSDGFFTFALWKHVLRDGFTPRLNATDYYVTGHHCFTITAHLLWFSTFNLDSAPKGPLNLQHGSSQRSSERSLLLPDCYHSHLSHPSHRSFLYVPHVQTHAHTILRTYEVSSTTRSLACHVVDRLKCGLAIRTLWALIRHVSADTF